MNDRETVDHHENGSTALRNVRFMSDGEYAWAYGETTEKGETIPILIIPKTRIADFRNGTHKQCAALTPNPSSPVPRSPQGEVGSPSPQQFSPASPAPPSESGHFG